MGTKRAIIVDANESRRVLSRNLKVIQFVQGDIKRRVQYREYNLIDFLRSQTRNVRQFICKTYAVLTNND